MFVGDFPKSSALRKRGSTLTEKRFSGRGTKFLFCRSLEETFYEIFTGFNMPVKHKQVFGLGQVSKSRPRF